MKLSAMRAAFTKNSDETWGALEAERAQLGRLMTICAYAEPVPTEPDVSDMDPHFAEHEMNHYHWASQNWAYQTRQVDRFVQENGAKLRDSLTDCLKNLKNIATSTFGASVMRFDSVAECAGLDKAGQAHLAMAASNLGLEANPIVQEFVGPPAPKEPVSTGNKLVDKYDR